MKISNIDIGVGVIVDPTTSINNVKLGDYVRIAKNCSIFGGEENQLEIGAFSYVGMQSMLNGYAEKLIIGNHVSIGQQVLIMVDSGPNASTRLQRLYPIISGPITIGDHCWIGSGSLIMPSVRLGEFCIVAANSFVNKSFPSFTMIGGNPAKKIRSFTEAEKMRLLDNEL